MKASLLVYDVPSALNIDNPSAQLRRRAVRINLSCWVVPEGYEPWNYLDELRVAGVSWHIIAFDASESDKLIALAKEAIAREVLAALERCRKSRDGAFERFEDDPSDASWDKVDATVDRAFERLEEVLQELEEAAGAFKLDAQLLPFDSARAQARKLKAMADVCAASIADLVKRVSETPIAEAAKNDEVLPLILADYAEDNGLDASAVRAVFK